jgi:hypothetical protein
MFGDIFSPYEFTKIIYDNYCADTISYYARAQTYVTVSAHAQRQVQYGII